MLEVESNQGDVAAKEVPDIEMTAEENTNVETEVKPLEEGAKRFGRFRGERKPLPEDVILRAKILKMGESLTEELQSDIIMTAGEINLQLTSYGEMIIDTLPKAMGRLAHKSVLLASLATKLDSLLSKTVIEEVITLEMPKAFQSADKMAWKAWIRFLGWCWINGVLEESVFLSIIQKMISKPSKLVALVALTTLPILLKIKPNLILEEALNSLSTYFDSLNVPVPSHLLPFRKFDESKDVYVKCEEIKAEPEVPKPVEEKVEAKPGEEAPSTEGTISLFRERAELETLKEDEYEDYIDEPKEEQKYEITELWECYKKNKNTTELKKFHQVLKTSMLEIFTVNETIIKEVDVGVLNFEPEKDIELIYKSRVLKPNVFSDYDNDELDYLMVYDIVADIISRFKDTTFTWWCQIQRLNIPGMTERILFDVIFSELFQLPHMPAHPLHYANIAWIMRKRLPIQAINLLIKKMPRMDPEIRLRFESFYAFAMNHMDFAINWDVIKRFIDKESAHYKWTKKLFDGMSIISFPKKMEDLIKEKKLPEEWIAKNFWDPVFIHGEDENDIKNLVEKMRFKDDSKDEFEKFLTGEEIEAKDEAVQEVLFEAVFRKANRNYSFMDKVLDFYSSTLQNTLTEKKKIVGMLYNMFKHNIEKFIVFMNMLATYKIYEYKDVTQWVLENETIEESHMYAIYKIMKELSEQEDYSQMVTILEDLKLIVMKDPSDWVKTSYGIAILRNHQAVLTSSGKWDQVKELFSCVDGFSEIVA